MEILNLNTNTLNQNGYHKTIFTPGKIGALYMFPQKYTPDDCLACDGYILKINDYLKLYSIIGSNYNSGNEAEDEFKIPDYNISGRFLQPSSSPATKKEAGLPNITGSVGVCGTGYTCTGAFYYLQKGSALSNSGEQDNVHGFDASRCSKIYGKSTTVQPPSQGVHVCIRYK